MITFEQTYDAPPERIWELWTTAAGIESWWAPDGFEVKVRLGYRSLIDFVPEVPPYEHLTMIELEPAGGGTRVTMTMEALHDEEWTQRLVAGRENELAKLALVA